MPEEKEDADKRQSRQENNKTHAGKRKRVGEGLY